MKRLRPSSPIPPVSDNGVTYLLTELQQCVTQKQDSSERMDKEVQYYFTLLGVTVASAGLIMQLGAGLDTFLLVSHFVLLITLMSGSRLYRRISYLSMMGALYAAQANLIRAFFVQRDDYLRHYLILTVASSDRSAHDYGPIRTRGSIKGLKLFNAVLLFVFIATLPLYGLLLAQSGLSLRAWLIVFGGSSLLALVSSLLLYLYQDSLVRNGGEVFLDRITSSVQQKIKERENYDVIYGLIQADIPPNSTGSQEDGS